MQREEGKSIEIYAQWCTEESKDKIHIVTQAYDVQTDLTCMEAQLKMMHGMIFMQRLIKNDDAQNDLTKRIN